MTSFLLLATMVGSRCDSKQETPQSELVLAAVVENIGKHPGASSGYILIYQLAKYGVVEVCAGTHDQKEIVVDHLLVSGDELKSLHVGDKVYLTLTPSKTIAIRYDEEGLRSSADKVETFYLGHTPDTVRPAQCKQ